MPAKLSIVIPVYKNAATLFELHARLRKVVDPSTEILFVNDACPAGSLDELIKLVKIDSYVSVLALEKNVGQNQAVMVGLAHAQGEIIVVMDADLQDPPEAIPVLLAALQDGIYAVFAGRRGNYESGARLFTSRLIKVLLSMFSGGRIPMDAGLFVAMRQEMVERILAYAELQPYVIGFMGWTGLQMVSVPVSRSPDRYGVTAYSARMRLGVALNALRVALMPKFRLLPLKGRDSDRPVRVARYYGARFEQAKQAV